MIALENINFYKPDGFYGTEKYYRLSCLVNLYGTDGIAYVLETKSCFWIGDIIASYYDKLLKRNYFYVVYFLKDEKQVIITDDNDEIVVKQDIEYTDLDCNLKFFMSKTAFNGKKCFVLMLPSEY